MKDINTINLLRKLSTSFNKKLLKKDRLKKIKEIYENNK